MIWCDGSDYVNDNCLAYGGPCGFISGGPWTDCSDGEIPEEYDSTILDECEEIVDPNAEEDSGVDAGADAGNTSSGGGDDGCGCATVGATSPLTSIISVLTSLF